MEAYLANLLAMGAVLSAVAVISVKSPVNAVLWLVGAFVCVAGYLVTLGMVFIGLSYIIVYVGAIAVLFLFVVMMLSVSSLQSATAPLQAHLQTNGSTASGPKHVLTGAQRQYNSKGPYASAAVPLAIAVVAMFFTSVYQASASVSLSVPLGLLSSLNAPLATLTGSVVDTAISNPLHVTADGLLTFAYSAPDTQAWTMSQVQSLGIILYTHGGVWLILTSVLLLLAMMAPIALCMEAVAKAGRS